MADEGELRRLICDVGHRVYAKGYVASNDGNISARLSDDEFLATPTGVSKGALTPDMICKVSPTGERLEGYLSPSSEIRLHLYCYRHRPDAHAVVHAHPPTATGFAVAGIALDQLTLPETIVSFGTVPLAPYATPGGDKLPRSIEGLVETCDAILLANHGAVTIGADVMSAYYKMETLEHTAKITWVARTLGGAKELSDEEAAELLDLREKLGYDARAPLCTTDSRLRDIQSRRAMVEVDEDDDDLTELVTRVTLEVLQERGLA
jgi:L-fuculose-phosphate aldolase